MSGNKTICMLRFCNIPGFEDRRNDAVYGAPLIESEKSDLVVFFPGDVQDFTENMQSHRDNKRYVTWNLENTILRLQMAFQDCHVIIVKPSRMEYKTFSCYNNFVPTEKCGAPQHTPSYGGLCHLEKLISSVSDKLKSANDAELQSALDESRQALLFDNDDVVGDSKISLGLLNELALKTTDLTRCNIKLVGFSKGCVVLNQFLYELHHCQTNTDSVNFISKIKDMYWLDGGHSGGKNTWITSKELLDHFARLGIRIHIHVTPYQIEDEHRPWIRKEEKLFYETLRKLGAPVTRRVYFKDEPRSLKKHFDVLNRFASD